MADTPRDVLQRVLSDLGIQRVVCVDDMYGATLDIPSLVIWAADSTNRSAVQGILKSHGVDINLDGDTATPELRSVLENRDEIAGSFQSAWDGQLLKGNSTDNSDQSFVDRIVIGRLDELFEGFADFRRFGPTDWQAHQQTLVNEMADHSTLFIFDENLGEHAVKGTEHIGTLASSTDGTKGNYVLLSYAVTQETEHERTRYFQRRGIAATAIPKRDLTSPANIEFLYVRLRAAIMWKKSTGLRRACVNAMKAAVKPAHERISELTPLEFDEVVFRSSHSEGVHEIDTLVRVFTNAFASQLRERMRKSRVALTEIGHLRQYRATEKVASVGSTAWKLQREEMYDTGDYINGCGIPIEAGDVFLVTSEAGVNLGEYVLLAQPCDLVVRSKTNSGGKRKVDFAILAPIRHREPAKNEKGVFALPCYSSDTGEISVVDMSVVCSLDLRILDLCVLNRNGVARIVLDGKAPVNMSVGWDLRLEKELLPFAREIATKWREWHAKPTAERLVGAELPLFCIPFGPSHLVQTKVNNVKKVITVSFGIQRTQRLSSSLAAELIQSFADHLSRPARPHSLSESTVLTI